MISSYFSYFNIFHLPRTIKDKRPDCTPDLAQDINKIAHLNISMKKLPKAVLEKVSMSPHWIRMGVVPSLFVQGLGIHFPSLTFFTFFFYMLCILII